MFNRKEWYEKTKRTKKNLGERIIMKKIKNVLLKCIRIGRKRMWIKAVPSGENIQEGKGSGIPSWIRNIG